MRAPLLLPAVAVLALAGCTAPAPVQPSRSAIPTSTPSATPVPAPSRLPGEIARTTVEPDRIEGVIDDIPRTARNLYVHALCTGPAGSTMRWTLEDGDARTFGPAADVVCTGSETVAGSAIDSPPLAAQVHVEPDRGVQGWAVLTTSAEGAG